MAAAGAAVLLLKVHHGGKLRRYLHFRLVEFFRVAKQLLPCPANPPILSISHSVFSLHPTHLITVTKVSFFAIIFPF